MADCATTSAKMKISLYFVTGNVQAWQRNILNNMVPIFPFLNTGFRYELQGTCFGNMSKHPLSKRPHFLSKKCPRLIIKYTLAKTAQQKYPQPNKIYQSKKKCIYKHLHTIFHKQFIKIF